MRNIVFLFFMMFCLGMPGALAADGPMALTADSIEYSNDTITATGNVHITRGTQVLDGVKAVYHVKNGTAELTGGARYSDSQGSLQAAVLYLLADGKITGEGGVTGTRGDRTFSGQTAQYDPDSGWALLTGSPQVSNSDTVIRSQQMEMWDKEGKILATGGAHIVSEARQLDAQADMATYYGPSTGEEKVVLEGNAVAVQKGDTLRGNIVTIYPAENAARSQGRSTLVIIPREGKS